MIHLRQFCASLRYIWVYILTYEYIYSHMSIYTHIFEYVYSCIWVCLSGMPPTSLHGTLGLDQVYIYIHKCIYIHISSYIYTYIHTNIHTYIHTDWYIHTAGGACCLDSRRHIYVLMYVHIHTAGACCLDSLRHQRVLTYVNVCRRMLTYADVCWRMQGPVARIAFGTNVPHGLHGIWVPDLDTS